MTPEQRRAWRRDVCGVAALTPAQRLVLLALETYADYQDGDDAYPGVIRLAEICGLGTRVVEAALSNGRRLCLIERTRPANPKRHHAAVYRLVSTRTGVRIKDEPSIRARMRVETDRDKNVRESCEPEHLPSSGDAEMSARTTAGRSQDAFQPAQNGSQPARNGVSTRTSVQPTYPKTPIQYTHPAAAGARTREDTADALLEMAITTRQSRQILNRLRREVLALLDHGQDDETIAVALVRWDQRPEAGPALLPHLYSDVLRENAIFAPARNGRADSIRNCPDCGGGHWLLGDDGTPLDPAVECTHPRLDASCD